MGKQLKAGDHTVLVDYNPGGVSRRYAVLKRLAEKTVGGRRHLGSSGF